MDSKKGPGVKALIQSTGRTLESHADALRQINENLVAAHRLVENYGQGIRANREALEGLVELVNAQTKAFNVMRDVVVKLWEDRYGLDAPSEVPAAIN